MNLNANQTENGKPKTENGLVSHIQPLSYLELLRPANVVTAVADVMAGYAVTGLAFGKPLAWLAGASACLYAGGVVLNDVFDRDMDRVERPERPIPSGRVAAATAAIMGGVLLALGVGFAAGVRAETGWTAATLAACILAYDAWGKRRAAVGPVNMALCRALNLLLGMAAAPAALGAKWTLGFLPLAYVYAVTMVSRGEVHGGARRTGGIAFALMTLVVISCMFLSVLNGDPSVAALVLSCALGAAVLPTYGRLVRSPDAGSIRRAVRTGVLSLVLLDAVVAAVYAGVLASVAVLATGVAALALARLFSVT